MSVTDQAFVTLAVNDLYCQGALVLGQSLRNHGTARKLVVLITPQVSGALRVVLSRVFDEVIEVNLSASEDGTHLAFRKRPELGVTLTKLHCWTLTQYSKGVFLDPDTLVLCNIDELFERREFSAAPDPGWPDCFNSGVFVFQPSLRTHGRLLQHAMDHGSFDGADQGLLNGFFRDWASADIRTHLPFIYNLSSSTVYTYGPAFQQFGASAKVIHFLGPRKPWSYTYHPQTGSVVEQGSGVDRARPEPFLSLWWAVYHAQVLPLYARGPDAQTRAGHTVRAPASLSPRALCPSPGLQDIAIPFLVWGQCTHRALLCFFSVPSFLSFSLHLLVLSPSGKDPASLFPVTDPLFCALCILWISHRRESLPYRFPTTDSSFTFFTAV